MSTLHQTTTEALLTALGGPYPQGRILALLRLRRNQIVSNAELIEYVWGDDPEGGPDNPRSRLSVEIYRLRRKGAKIINVHGRGYQLIFAPANLHPKPRLQSWVHEEIRQLAADPNPLPIGVLADLSARSGHSRNLLKSQVYYARHHHATT